MSAAAGSSTIAAARHGGLPKALALAGVGVLASIVALSIDTRLSYLLLYAWFGIGYGLLLQPKSGSYPVAGSPVGGLNGARVGAILSLT